MLKDLLGIIDKYQLDKTGIAHMCGFSHGGVIGNWDRRGNARVESVVAVKDALVSMGEKLQSISSINDLDSIPVRKTYFAEQVGIPSEYLSRSLHRALLPEKREQILQIAKRIGDEIYSKLSA